MQRREFLLILGSASLASARSAVADEKSPRIGYLSGRSAAADRMLIEAFKEGLRSLGFVDGQNVTIVYRAAEGDRRQLDEYARALFHLKVDVMFSSAGFSAAEAAHKAREQSATGGDVPLVFVVGGDPVKEGLVSNVARPDRNMTGVTTFNSTLELKQLELLRDLVGAKKRLGALLDARSTSTRSQVERIVQAKSSLGIEVDIRTAESVPQLESELDSLSSGGVDAVLVGAGSFFAANRKRIVSHAQLVRLPALYSQPEYAREGGLASYSYSTFEIYRTAGEYVARVLNGVATTELPVRMPALVELILNLRAAKELDLRVPREILELANEIMD